MTSADDRGRRAMAATRWFAGYLAVLGVASAVWIAVIETVFVDGFARALAGTAWAVAVLAVGWWGERQAVHPRGATRTQILAAAVWFGGYLFVVGPVIRGLYGQAILPWVIGSAALALPFFVAAAWSLLRR